MPTERDLYQLALGKVVSELRKAQGMDQQELAAKVGISQPTLSRIERGLVMPDHWTFRQLARALDFEETSELEQLVDEAVERVREAAGKLAGVPDAEGDDAGSEAGAASGVLGALAGVLGGAALAALVAFAVASLLDSDRG